MSNSINQVTLLGRLGADAELRNTQGGKSVLNWRMATSEQWTDNGQKQERTEWHTCVMWGNYAAAIAKYLTTGKRIHVTGKLQTRKWTDKNNVDRYTTEINVRDLVLLDGGTDQKPAGNSQQQSAGGSRNYRPRGETSATDAQGMPWDNAPADAPGSDRTTSENPPAGYVDDDIPF
jgi:single-strand DNA-binding protein